MQNKGLLTIIKSFIASVGWKMFLWGNSYTQEEYWEQIYWQEFYFKNPTNDEYED